MVNPVNLAKHMPCVLPGIEILRSVAIVDSNAILFPFVGRPLREKVAAQVEVCGAKFFECVKSYKFIPKKGLVVVVNIKNTSCP